MRVLSDGMNTNPDTGAASTDDGESFVREGSTIVMDNVTLVWDMTLTTMEDHYSGMAHIPCSQNYQATAKVCSNYMPYYITVEQDGETCNSATFGSGNSFCISPIKVSILWPLLGHQCDEDVITADYEKDHPGEDSSGEGQWIFCRDAWTGFYSSNHEEDARVLQEAGCN